MKRKECKMELILFAIFLVFLACWLNRYLNKKYPKNNNSINEPPLLPKTDYTAFYSKKRNIMTNNELKFYRLLKYKTDKNNLLLFTQVALYSLISSKDISYFNKIRSKTIDFVITDINGKIVTCIELDDPSHVKDNRQERDNFIDELFKQLDISLIRIPVQGYYDMQEIENKIKEKI